MDDHVEKQLLLNKNDLKTEIAESNQKLKDETSQAIQEFKSLRETINKQIKESWEKTDQ